MSEIPQDPVSRATRYLCGRYRLRKAKLGWGTDGVVFSVAETSSVIKVHESSHRFQNELKAYLRLQAHGVNHIGRFAVPELRNHHSALKIVEISHVRPPYLIDFGKSVLDQPPDFEPEAWDWWYNRLKFKFGRRATEAIEVYERLAREYGVYHLDLSPDNLRVPDDEAAAAHEGLGDDDDPDHET